MNIILIVIDSLRKDCVAAYGPTVGRKWFGKEIETPTLTRFAATAMIFRRAFPEALPTVVFRRSINTGRRVFPFRNYRPTKWDMVYLPGWQPIDEDVDTLAEALARAGYRTGYISDCLPVFQPSANFHRGFHHWHFIRGQQQDRWQSLSCGQHTDLASFFVSAKHRAVLEDVLSQYAANTSLRKSEEDWFAPQVYRLASRWIEENARQTPFFLMIDCWDPHEPWDPPRHYAEFYHPGHRGKNPIHPLYSTTRWLSDAELQQMRANYCGEVTMMDRWLGQFLQRVDDLGLRQTTAVAIISDHGHSLGDRNVTGKIPACQHKELVELVLMLRHPDGCGAGQTNNAFVYNIDVVTTLAAWAGVKLQTDGLDLTPVLRGGASCRDEQRSYVTGAFDNWATYQDRRYKLIQSFRGIGDPANSKLYDLGDDPMEQRNIAVKKATMVKELYQRILKDAGGKLPTYQMPWTFADGSRPLRKR
ncbi:MAG: sulfatase [Verrucomicrobia bacterium]|nr:sulfatase [Verrucomicrobiota bacterium]